MSSRFIEDYSFGKIVIDGKKYTDDVILLGAKVKPGWWRKSGHRVTKRDLKDVITYDPDLLIIGTGSSGRMSVPSGLSSKLNFDLQSHITKKACKKYNQLLSGDRKVAGAFHLTC